MDLTKLNDAELREYEIELTTNAQTKIIDASWEAYQYHLKYARLIPTNRVSELRNEYNAAMEAVRSEWIMRRHPRCIARLHNSWELP